MSYAMSVDQTQITEFTVGFSIGFVVLSALFRMRAIAEAALCILVLALVYTLWAEGVHGLVRVAGSVLQEIREHDLIFKGVACGKVIAGLIQWREARRCRERQP